MTMGTMERIIVEFQRASLSTTTLRNPLSRDATNKLGQHCDLINITRIPRSGCTLAWFHDTQWKFNGTMAWVVLAAFCIKVPGSVW